MKFPKIFVQSNWSKVHDKAQNFLKDMYEIEIPKDEYKSKYSYQDLVQFMTEFTFNKTRPLFRLPRFRLNKFAIFLAIIIEILVINKLVDMQLLGTI